MGAGASTSATAEAFRNEASSIGPFNKIIAAQPALLLAKIEDLLIDEVQSYQETTLKVKIIRAHGLPDMDRKTKSDPYVAARLTRFGDKRKDFIVTSTVKNELSPSWNEGKGEVLTIEKVKGTDTLELRVYDDDSSSTEGISYWDDMIAKVQLSVMEQKRDMEVDLDGKGILAFSWERNVSFPVFDLEALIGKGEKPYDALHKMVQVYASAIPKDRHDDATKIINQFIQDWFAAEEKVEVEPAKVEAPPIRMRKEMREMSQAEQDRVVAAFKTMMISDKPGGSEMHRIGGYHGWPSTNPDGSKGFCAHRAENFPGWHRAYLLEMENALCEADKANGNDGNIGLPYWDWRRVELNGQCMPDSIRKNFGSDFKFPENFFDAKDGENKLTRDGYSGIRSEDELRERLLDADVKGKAEACIDTTKNSEHWQHASTEYRKGTPIETPHNSVHNCVGFPLTSLNYAGFHPIFHMLHCNVDRIHQKYLELMGPDECIAHLLDHQAAMEQDGLRNLAETPLLPFKKVGTASAEGDPSEFWTLREMMRIENFGYAYDVLPPKPKQNLEEMPTMALFEDVDVVRKLMGEDGEMKSLNLHVFVVKRGEGATFKPPATFSEFKGCANFSGTGAAFGGKGPLCVQCAETKPINILVDITQTLRSLGIASRHSAELVVVVEDEFGEMVSLDQVTATFGEQCVVPAPRIVGPYFEANQATIVQGSGESAAVMQLQKLLSNMGYYAGTIDGTFGEATKTAVLRAQKAAGLKADGIVGKVTMSKLIASVQDCPHKEDKATFAPGSKVTWWLGATPGSLNHEETGDVIAAAFQEWAVPTGLSFERVKDKVSADVKVTWSDMSSSNEFQFDGPGGKLGHADAQSLSFDAAERWELSAEKCTQAHQFNLAAVALHEIGHVLGLVHDDDPMAVMAPYYNESRTTLRSADVARAKALYAA